MTPRLPKSERDSDKLPIAVWTKSRNFMQRITRRRFSACGSGPAADDLAAKQ
jgi:hypothetical protein